MYRIIPLILTLLTFTVKSQPEQEVTPLMICAACKSLVKFSLKKLNGRTSEMDVTDVLDFICHPNNFPDSEFPPPYMNAACEKLIRAHYDDIEDALVQRKTEVDLDMKICIDDLKACNDAMDLSIKNKDLEKGIDGRYDMSKIQEELMKRGGDFKIAGAGQGDETDLYEQMGEAFKAQNLNEDL